MWALRWLPTGKILNSSPELILQAVKSEDENIPFLLQSSDLSNEAYARELGVGFLHKHSKNLSNDLKEYILRICFGEFVFRDPVTLADILCGLQTCGTSSSWSWQSDNILIYHTKRMNISKWLNCPCPVSYRSDIQASQTPRILKVWWCQKVYLLRPSPVSAPAGQGGDWPNLIVICMMSMSDSHVSVKAPSAGKARGLAFFDSFLKKDLFISKHPIYPSPFPTQWFSVPRCLMNSCRKRFIFFSCFGISDEDILKAFVSADCLNVSTRIWVLSFYRPGIQLPYDLQVSSEDSYYQPIRRDNTTTYMIPIVPVKGSGHPHARKQPSNAFMHRYSSDPVKHMPWPHPIDWRRKDGYHYPGSLRPAVWRPVLSPSSQALRVLSIFIPLVRKNPGWDCHHRTRLGKLIAEGGTGLRFSPNIQKKSFIVKSRSGS